LKIIRVYYLQLWQLEYNKNYATLALNYILKNLKKTILALKIRKRYRNNDILKEIYK